MSITHIHRIDSLRVASFSLVFVTLYQLGACPCGCWEHNLWIQLIGIGDHAQEPVVDLTDDSGLVVSDAHDHDCTGEPRPRYLDNARSPKVISNPVFCSLDGCDFQSAGVGKYGGHRQLFSGSLDYLGYTPARSRPALQVYQL